MHLTNATPNLVRQHKFSIISRLKLFVLQDHMVVSCIDFLLMLVFFFYHIHVGFYSLVACLFLGRSMSYLLRCMFR